MPHDGSEMSDKALDKAIELTVTGFEEFSKAGFEGYSVCYAFDNVCYKSPETLTLTK